MSKHTQQGPEANASGFLALREAERWLRQQLHFTLSPEVEARELLGLVTGYGRTQLFLNAERPLGAEGWAALEALLERRRAGEPLQHLLGQVEWGGLTLKTDRRALIPRPETEWLLQLAQADLRRWAAPRVLDVGTGTGALALALKAAVPTAQVTATDISGEALSLARENAELNGLEVQFIQADLLAGLAGPFDMVISNPPYLPAADQLAISLEVSYDPPLALYGGPDGLDLARPLAAEAGKVLGAGGVLWLELDPRNAPQFATELRGQGWQAELHADFVGRVRFVRAIRR